MRYYLIAGEASGDLHASRLMRSLKTFDERAEFRFFGGEQMQQAGGTLWTAKQIKENMGKSLFSAYFEKEYPYLQNTVMLADIEKPIN